MSIYNSIFLFQMLAGFMITFFQFYNVLNLFNKNKIGSLEDNTNGDKSFFPYDIKVSFLFFIGILFCYGLGMVISMYAYDETIYLKLMYVMRILLLLNVLFFIIEIFTLVVSSANVAVKAFQSKPR